MAKIKELNMTEELAKSELELLKPAYVRAVNLMEQALDGLPVNKDNQTNARLIITQYRGTLQAVNNRRTRDLTDKKFNYMLLNQFGSEQHKKKLKEVFSKQFKDIKIIEKR